MLDPKSLDAMENKARQNAQDAKKPKRTSPMFLVFTALCVFALIALAVIFLPPMLSTLNARASDKPAPAGGNTSPNVVIPAPTQAVVPTAAPVVFSWDGTFGGINAADEYVVDGDSHVTGRDTQGAEMSFTCSAPCLGVFISTDSGVVQGVSTNGKGAAAFIPASGSAIKFSTPSWSGSHQQAHLVQVVKKLPDAVSYRDLLVALMHDENKPLGLMFAPDGTHEEITGAVASSSTSPNTPATVETLGPDPRHNIQIAAEMIRGGNELLPLRGDPTATIQHTVNDMGMDGTLNISVDPGSTVKLFDATGKEVAKVTDLQGFTAIMPFPKGWSTDVLTTWNYNPIDKSGNLTWNVWEEFYIPRTGYSADDFKWVNILYWDATQGKPHNYFYDGTTFKDLGPNPARP